MTIHVCLMMYYRLSYSFGIQGRKNECLHMMHIKDKSDLVVFAHSLVVTICKCFTVSEIKSLSVLADCTCCSCRNSGLESLVLLKTHIHKRPLSNLCRSWHILLIGSHWKVPVFVNVIWFSLFCPAPQCLCVFIGACLIERVWTCWWSATVINSFMINCLE